MSALVYGKSLTKSYGINHLFRDLTLSISEKDRIGIIGPNGSGKTTLLKILAGLEQPDQGNVTRRQYLRIGYVPQHVEFNLEGTVAGEIERAALESGMDPHDCIARVQETLGRTGFEDGNQAVAPLSGGWRKRLAIACGMVQSPDVMLLDEPTNHLDLEGMWWLEQMMSQAPWPWVVVSHDRWFLEQATNQIAEVNTRYSDGIFLVSGTYAEFIRQREAFHQTQTQQAQALAGKVRREVEWLRRGPKARTTKAKYRVAAAHSLQAELSETATRLKDESNFHRFRRVESKDQTTDPDHWSYQRLWQPYTYSRSGDDTFTWHGHGNFGPQRVREIHTPQITCQRTAARPGYGETRRKTRDCLFRSKP